MLRLRMFAIAIFAVVMAFMSVPATASADVTVLDPFHPWADILAPNEEKEKASQEKQYQWWLATHPYAGGLTVTTRRAIDAPFGYLYTPNYPQMNDHYCGPATVQIICGFFKKLTSQVDIAGFMRTSDEGTNFTVVDDAIRFFCGQRYFYYAGMKSSPDIYRRIEYAIGTLKRPVAIDVRIAAAFWDNYVYNHAGHILPAESFDWRAGQYTIGVNDPYNEATYHPGGGATLGHKRYPRQVIAVSVLNSLRPDLIY